ncbi:MAG: hypothetical protein GF381_04150 [Candidatus Pacebacteria bacterium]|nr:hypothetical protein [Candidatus Paceibacterota bacterium]
MKEQLSQETFEQLDLKTKVWAVLSAAMEETSIEWLLCVLGYDTEKAGIIDFDSSKLDPALVAQIKKYKNDYQQLTPEEKKKKFKKSIRSLEIIKLLIIT